MKKHFSMADFGERLRITREEKGISQQKLAEMIGVKSGKQTISRWEKGKAEPSISDLRRIADVLSTTVSFLVDGVELVGEKTDYVPKAEVDELKQELFEAQRELLKLQRQKLEEKAKQLEQSEKELERQKRP